MRYGELLLSLLAIGRNAPVRGRYQVYLRGLLLLTKVGAQPRSMETRIVSGGGCRSEKANSDQSQPGRGRPQAGTG